MVKQKWYIRKTKQLFLGWMFICVFVTQAFWSVPTAHAWDAALGAIVHRALDTVYEQLEGAILGTLKVSAIKILNSKVAQMVGGSSVGDALFITDWGDFLYNTPAEKTKLFMNDFFTLTTRGKYASANYVGIGDVAGNVSGNYAGYLRSRAENSIGVFYSGTQSYFEYDLDQYADNPERMFQEGDWRGFNAFFSNPMNNPFGYELVAQGVYAERLAQEQDAARTKAISPGFVGPTDANGNTIAPAATIEAMTTNVQNIGNNLIAAATNPGEFLSGVVGALVNKTVSSLVQRGVGQVQANIQRGIDSVDNKVVGALDQANRALGPAAQFTSEVSQKTDVYVRPYTKPPPPANGDGGY
ncbi:MAG: hypothetical protein KBD65_00350 [Candidatus Moranbacteria bacterium]|nr:hypothetical protein [Candidatus Moranbacteria bacterium]